MFEILYYELLWCIWFRKVAGGPGGKKAFKNVPICIFSLAFSTISSSVLHAIVHVIVRLYIHYESILE